MRTLWRQQIAADGAISWSSSQAPFVCVGQIPGVQSAKPSFFSLPFAPHTSKELQKEQPGLCGSAATGSARSSSPKCILQAGARGRRGTGRGEVQGGFKVLLPAPTLSQLSAGEEISPGKVRRRGLPSGNRFQPEAGALQPEPAAQQFRGKTLTGLGVMGGAPANPLCLQSRPAEYTKPFLFPAWSR